jgi:AI-2 transport protein TqsA
MRPSPRGDTVPAMAVDELAASPPPLLPRGLVMVLGAAATAITVGAMRELSWLLGPVFLALMLVIAVSPVQRWLRRGRVPRWLITIISVLLVYSILVALVTVLSVAIAQLISLIQLPSQDRLNQLQQELFNRLQGYGIDPKALQQQTASLGLGKIGDILPTLLGQLTSLTSTMVLVLLLLLFMGMDAVGFTARLVAVRALRPSVAEALTAFANGTRRYLVVSSIFGAICALLDALALQVLGVPTPALWAVLAFMTNYVPNIGFFIGLIPPALLALLNGGGPRQALLVVGSYILINIVIQTIIQPKFVGDVVGLSVTMTFLATAFWAWVLGPLGALLAIPMTLLAKALLIDVDPSTRWIDTLIGSGVPPPTRPERGGRPA